LPPHTATNDGGLGDAITKSTKCQHRPATALHGGNLARDTCSNYTDTGAVAGTDGTVFANDAAATKARDVALDSGGGVGREEDVEADGEVSRSLLLPFVGVAAAALCACAAGVLARLDIGSRFVDLVFLVKGFR